MTIWRLNEAAAPPVAVEFSAQRVAAASLDVRSGQATIAAYAAEPLAAGALVPSLTNTNVADRPVVVGALGRVFDRLGGRPRRVAVIVPDIVAKVSLVRFEHVPSRAADLDQLVRWQVRKTAPFPIEDAQVSYVPGLRAADGQEFVVSIARREVVKEYESLCEEVGAYPGLVDLATFNVINAVLAGSTPPSTDWLLIHVTADSASTAILRGEHLIFFRNRGADGDGTLLDLVHQAAMYYEDRLEGQGFARVLLAGMAAVGSRTSDIEQARRSLEERLSRSVELFDPREGVALADRITPPPALLDALTPMAGVLLRDRENVHAAR